MFQRLITHSRHNVFVLLLSLLLPLSNTALAETGKGIMDAYEAERVADNTWVVFGPREMPNPTNKGFMNNPGFVVTEKSVIVVDPGSTVHVGRALLEKIRAKTVKPITHVFNSHIHGDHWLGNQAIAEAYPEVKIYAHPKMIEEAKAGEAENWVGLLNTLTEGASDGTKAVLPTIALENGQTVAIDGVTVKAHLSEIAHTKTDAMIEIVNHKVLFTGDNVFNLRVPRLDDGSYVGNIEAIDYALELPIETVVPGHGPKGGKEVLSIFRDFLYTLYDTSRSLYEDDMEAFEMKPTVVEKMDAFKDWAGFDEGIGKLISVAVLEVERSE